MLKSLVDNFLGRACYFCERPCAGSVCPACDASLPWNASACEHCALPLASGGRACGACLTAPPPQDCTWAAFRYQAPVPREVVKLKFRGELMPAHVLGELMAQKLAARPRPLPALLIPVPLHDRRLRRRGYNQALELARHLSHRLSIPLDARGACRDRPTHEQTDLAAADRRRNVRGAFSVRAAVAGKHIALLDDVITTGATAAELARVVRKAGAGRIEVWAAARA